MTLKRLLLPLLLLLTSISHSGEALHIAVASSFRPTLDKLVSQFQRQSGINCVLSSAATGVLYAQIVNGAGFDLLLAADSWRPSRLIEAGYARSEDRYSYALGKLILVGAKGELDDATASSVASLLTDKQPRIAIANPATAPYGLASRQSLEQLQLWTATAAQRITGQNAAQAFQFFTTGNSDFAFASLAQWRNWKQSDNSSYWLLPSSYYQPLRHDALLLGASKQNTKARRFVEFLLSASSAAILREDGYGVPSNT